MKSFKVMLLTMLLGLAFPVWAAEGAVSDGDTVAQTSTYTPIPQDKLDSLLAPVALYPDQLLVQTLMAATYPLDVVEAARFVSQNKELKGEALDKEVLKKKWDPSVQSLTAFPQVLEMMNEKLEWTQELGNAFLDEQQRVMQTVQDLRQKAYAAGNLKSSEQQTVVKDSGTNTIIIEPARTEVVYVPTYNPTVVYGTWWAPAYPPYYYPPPAYYYPPGSVAAAGLIGFGLGLAIADNHWGWGHADWHGGDVDIDINRNNSFVNNNTEFKNKVNNGKWEHNASQRKGVAYGSEATRDKFRGRDSGAVSSRREARGYDRGAGAGTRDVGRADRGGSFGSRDMQQGMGDRGAAGDRVSDRGGSRDFNSRGSSGFDASRSREQTRSFSERGASSRSSMGSGRSFSGGRSGGGGGRGGRR